MLASAQQRFVRKTLTFTNSWFDTCARAVWDDLIPKILPRRILEVGSYEGASAVYLIEKLAPDACLEIHCVDTWKGGLEHCGTDMGLVEAAFLENTRIAVEASRNAVELVVHKGLSDVGLCRLLATRGPGYFDFVYIDGSHEAADVLCDAVLGFRLLRIGGVMAFDDYLWSQDLGYGKDPLLCPKPAIDAFINLNFRKLTVLNAPLYQIFVQKLAE